MRLRLISGKRSLSNPVRYALVVFVVGMVVGVGLTHYVAGRLVADKPTYDGFDTIRSENRATKSTLIGWGVTFAASAVIAVAMGYWFYDPYAPRADDTLGQSRGDEA